jgi:hypothetical protein
MKVQRSDRFSAALCSSDVCEGPDVLVAVVMNSSVFWYMTPCNPLKIIRRFGGTCNLLFHARIKIQARNQREAEKSVCWKLGSISETGRNSVSQSESELLYNWRSVSQYVLVSSPIWDFWPEILFFLFIYFLKVTVLSYLGRPLWREVGSVICQSTVSLQ